MYAALWRILPGRWWLRVLILIALAAVVTWALVTWVFPFADSFVEPNVTVGSN
ncbi:DUF4175 domain-containing protein [Frondihabitans australicus]|uniref:Uncharacterized protein n=1 Tax=Frondihabitans australicus TaxID=386892 RepID=A0A495IIJ7_9MICO|nr:DUF4175 domain-containing protein [Frondihabitans australicus]RKR75814.1 hypothetical protein C8E83_2971 [Frondihabitans australicus]